MSFKGLCPLFFFCAYALFPSEGVSASQNGIRLLGSKKLDYSEDQPILGISSIRYDKAHHQFILLSDDTGAVPNYYNKNGQPRYYLVPEETLINKNGLVKNKGTFPEESVTRIREVIIEPNDSVFWTTHGHIDTEGFDFLGDNAFLVASEQSATFLFNSVFPWIRFPGWNIHSSLLKVGRDGTLLGAYYYPGEFSSVNWRFHWKTPHWVPGIYDSEFSLQIQSPSDKGVKRNRGFETVIHLPGTSDYLAITEQGVLQDEKDWDYHKGPVPSRVLRFSMVETANHLLATVEPDIQYHYQPTSVPVDLYDPQTDVIVQSISDAQAINDHQLLVIEKNHVKKANRKTVNYSYSEVYLVDLNNPVPPSRAVDGSGSEEDSDKLTEATKTSLPMLDKQRLLSTRDFEKTFPDFKRINIEGITLGPDGSDGTKLLVLVSDNGANSPKPRNTDIIFFKVPEKLFKMQ
ncbi:esterase-like activity of phytase family protein [Endozoicomonas sp. SESOKO4]|uniref:esterase-like activity of phytase family protein n=1 Tax=Endozoicomonas sp. SESOKO4 TaxID=2828745 RepID=UPI0021495C1F|nr:esterase-like activity of phytase family protein [Endozoicomonas sp. SESOKO4]